MRIYTILKTYFHPILNSSNNIENDLLGAPRPQEGVYYTLDVHHHTKT